MNTLFSSPKQSVCQTFAPESRFIGAVAGIILSAVLAFLFTPKLHAQTSYNLTIKAGPLRQSFAGFGASQADKTWNNLTATPRDQMADMVYRDLNMNLLRLWLTTTDDRTVNDMLTEFNTRYVASGAISAIKSRGISTLLLAPGRGAGVAAPASISTYADNLAEVILRIKNTYGVNIDVTGIANEPEPDWTSAQIVDCINALRTSLDSRGLTDVKIIAPETYGPAPAPATVNAIYDNGTAWSNIYGIATHSYGMLPDNGLEIGKRDKPWWITEASGNDVNEQADDENQACTLLARFICEMNHGANEWVFFIGLGEQADVSTYPTGTAFLMLYDQKTASIVPFLKYYYFKQTLNSFNPGCVFRKCVSGTEGDMFVSVTSGTYQHPAINAAAAYNPDGSWGINIINDTGVTGSLATSTKKFYTATTYNVTMTVEELANTPSMDFTVYRSRANNHFVTSGTVTLVNGIGTIAVAPRELVSLRSGTTPLSDLPEPNGLTASVICAPVALAWNNTVKATSWHVKRATVSGGPYTTIATTTTTSYEDDTAANGTSYFYVVSAVNSAGESANSAEVVASPSPFPWANVDIGNVGVTGSCSVSDDGVFTTYGAGTFISNSTGAYNLTYQTMTGNGTLIARVTGHTQPRSLVGIMMTETLGVGSKAASIIYDFNSAYLKAMMCVRTVTGNYGNWYFSNITEVPTWLKLVRSGNTFTGYASTDGTNWTSVGSGNISMSSTIYIGLVNNSTDTSALNIGTLDNVSAPCAAPTNLTQTASPGQIKLGWTACYGATSYNIKRATVSGGPYTTLGTATSPTLSYTDTTVASGSNYYYVVSAVNAYGESQNSAEYAAWMNADIGAVGVSGNCSISADGVFTINGGGTFISNLNGAYNLTYRAMTGDGTFVARVAGNTHPNALIGIMMTETLGVGSKSASVIYDFNTAYLQAMMCMRTVTGINGQWSFSNVTQVPTWLKLVRSGNTFTGYASADGTTWTTVGSGNIPMNSTIYMGLVNCAVSTTQLDTATLDNMTPP